MTLRRFSSRTEPLDTAFLAKSLQGASKYYRIAGYFRSSIFELIGEEISKIPDVRTWIKHTKPVKKHQIFLWKKCLLYSTNFCQNEIISPYQRRQSPLLRRGL